MHPPLPSWRGFELEETFPALECCASLGLSNTQGIHAIGEERRSPRQPTTPYTFTLQVLTSVFHRQPAERVALVPAVSTLFPAWMWT